MSQNYGKMRFAAELPPLTTAQKRLAEKLLAETPLEGYWNPLARRALMEAFARDGINFNDPASVRAGMLNPNREGAPILPIDNHTPYFPATKPWGHKCTAVIRERVALAVRVLGIRSLILTEKMALYVGDFAEYMQDGSIGGYFDVVGTVSIDASIMAFVDDLLDAQASALIHGIIRREYSEFRAVYQAEVAEVRGGVPAVDQPRIKELMEVRRLAHAEFDRDFAALDVNLSGNLEAHLRRYYPW